MCITSEAHFAGYDYGEPKEIWLFEINKNTERGFLYKTGSGSRISFQTTQIMIY